MNKEEIKFYSIGRGSLNLDGKFYYGLDYAITDFMRNLQQENNQLKENNQTMQEEMCRTWEKLNIIKELRSWLENKLASDNYTDGMYYGFKSCLLKLNELEGGKNE